MLFDVNRKEDETIECYKARLGKDIEKSGENE